MTERPVALVTGSGKRNRLGWHIAQALALRGYDLAVHYRTSQAEAEVTVDEIRRQGSAAESFPANLGDETEVVRLVERVLERFRKVDVLVNCAAIYQPKRLEDVAAADVRTHFEANVLGTFLCAQHVGLNMVRQP